MQGPVCCLVYVSDAIKIITLPVTIIKGTGHDFSWSGKLIYHLQKQGNIHIFQNK